MSEQTFFSKLSFFSISLFICSVFLIALCFSSLIISEIDNGLNSKDRQNITNLNICNGLIGFIAILISVVSFYLVNKNQDQNTNDNVKIIFIVIGILLFCLTIAQYFYISNISSDFPDSSKKSLYICSTIVCIIGLMFLGYGIYLYIKNKKTVELNISGDVLSDLEKKLTQANENAENILKSYGPKDLKYVEAKRKANEIKEEIDLFASEYNANIKRSKDVKQKTDEVRGFEKEKTQK